MSGRVTALAASTAEVIDAWMAYERIHASAAEEWRMRERFQLWFDAERAKSYYDGYEDGWNVGHAGNDSNPNHDNPYSKENS